MATAISPRKSSSLTAASTALSSARKDSRLSTSGTQQQDARVCAGRVRASIRGLLVSGNQKSAFGLRGRPDSSVRPPTQSFVTYIVRVVSALPQEVADAPGEILIDLDLQGRATRS